MSRSEIECEPDPGIDPPHRFRGERRNALDEISPVDRQKLRHVDDRVFRKPRFVLAKCDIALRLKTQIRRFADST